MKNDMKNIVIFNVRDEAGESFVKITRSRNCSIFLGFITYLCEKKDIFPGVREHKYDLYYSQWVYILREILKFEI